MAIVGWGASGGMEKPHDEGARRTGLARGAVARSSSEPPGAFVRGAVGSVPAGGDTPARGNRMCRGGMEW